MQRRYKNKTMMLEKNPYLINQWDFNKNKGLDPKLLTVSSNKKVFWVCNKGLDHKWKASVQQRTVRKTGCPYCKNQKASSTNNLKKFFPQIAKEWDFKKNKLNPNQVLPKANKKFWWICKNKHSYRAKASNRTALNRGCPYCSGRYASKENNLLTKYPEKAKLFDVKKNKITPDKIPPNTGKKYWWKCKKGHSYYQVAAWVYDLRAKKSSGCPYCKGLKVSKETSLAFLYPKLIKDWDNKKNGSLTPIKVTAGTDRAVWWKCKKNHSWKANINSRVYGTDCPYCQKKTTSFAEIRIYSEIIKIFPDVIRKDRSKKIELDLYLPKENIGIEFDGSHWHKNKKIKDLEKNYKLKKFGIHVIRMREKPLEILDKNDIQVNSHKLLKKDIDQLLRKILKFVDKRRKKSISNYLKKKAFVNDNFYNKLVSNFPGPIYQDSFEFRYPELLKFWDHKKNKNLSPKLFSYASNEKVWWICKKDNHSWYAPFNRVRKSTFSPCKICSIETRKSKGWFKYNSSMSTRVSTSKN